MPEGLKHVRNIAIILAIAAAVDFIPGGSRAAETITSALWAAFAFAIVFLGLRMYRERHMTLYGLGDRHRGLLYGAVAVAMFLWASRGRLWPSWDGLGEVLWFALAAGVVASLLAVYRHAREY